MSPAAANPHDVAVTVAHELRVQDRLPSEESPRAVTHSGGPASVGPPPAPAPSTLAPAFGWIALVLGAVFIAMLLIDALSGGRRRRLAALAVVAAGDEAAVARGTAAHASLATADELAAAGRYTEAIHQLLSDAVAMLRRRLGAELPDALTSREIVRALRLPDAQRGALSAIVTRVEQTWFARRAAVAEDYDAVRASFRVFTTGDAGA